MSQKLSAAIAVIGIDIGKNSFHIVGLNARTFSPTGHFSVSRLIISDYFF